MKKFVFTCLLYSILGAAQAQSPGNPAIKTTATGQPRNLEIDTAVVVNDYTDPSTGIRFVNLQQRYQGLRVHGAVKTLAYRNGIEQSAASTFVNDLATLAPDQRITVDAGQAVISAAGYLGLRAGELPVITTNAFQKDKTYYFSPGSISSSPMQAELVWVQTASNIVRTAWNITIAPPASADIWLIAIDAQTGAVLRTHNYTAYDNFAPKQEIAQSIPAAALPVLIKEDQQLRKIVAPPPGVTTSASYKVIPFPVESLAAGNIAIETDPWLKAGAGNAAITNGWHFDGTNNYAYTRGNNVYAYDDSSASNQPGRPDTSSTSGTVLTFTNTPDFSLQPTAPVNRRFAVDNLFYWNNIMHDVFYQYGFTEKAGNFQQDNMGRGTVASGPTGFPGNDAVRAEAQDGGGLNNANFSTLPDGQPPRMQMYLFSSAHGSALQITAPASLAKKYTSPEGNLSLSSQLARKGPVTGALVLFNDDSTGATNYACNGPANVISGRIAVIARGGPGGCTSFTSKVKNAQVAGAIAVIVVDNSINATPTVMNGADNSIVIPSVMISRADGQSIITALKAGQTVTATLSAAVQFDADLDNGVITHEYAHGISNRLTGGLAGGASCLNNFEQGGEGWSDYVALMMTTNWSKALVTDGPAPRLVGVYVNSQLAGNAGIRTFPYSTNMSINPLTYANISDNISNPRFDPGGRQIPTATEVHFIGEVWCAALWDMTWNIIEQENRINPNLYDAAGAGGNVIALRLVTYGMQLQPCSPGFLDARNAILKADSILYNFAHRCAIWQAFARRGMGVSAKQGSSNNTTDQTQAFDVPSFVTPAVTISSGPAGGLCQGATFTFTATSVNGGPTPRFQWFRNGQPESGATGAGFTSTKWTNNDSIRCQLLSNAGCLTAATVLSNTAAIQVNSVPAVSVSPAGPLTLCPGDSVVLTSTSSVGNQWHINGTPITGATDAKFSVKSAGSYTDSVAGSNGCRGGNDAVVVSYNPVSAAPVISMRSDTLVSSAPSGNQWYLNATALQGETGQTIKVRNSGTYVVKYTDSKGCLSASSIPMPVVVTAVANTTVNSSVWTVYPNPVKTFLRIKKSTILSAGVTAQVIDQQGRVVADRKLGPDNQWNLGSLASGNYWIRIIEQKNVFVYSFIKE